MNRHEIIKNIIIGLIMIGIGGGFWAYTRYGKPVPMDTISTQPLHAHSPIPVEAPSSVTVYVTGAVLSPGIYAIPSESRVIDAIRQAGGYTAQADLTSLNLAAKCKDGQKIWVKALKVSVQDSIKATPHQPPTIHINTASEDEFQLIPGIGPKTAQAIVKHRTQYGYFRHIEDLAEVKGISTKTLNRVAPYLSL